MLSVVLHMSFITDQDIQKILKCYHHVKWEGRGNCLICVMSSKFLTLYIDSNSICRKILQVKGWVEFPLLVLKSHISIIYYFLQAEYLQELEKEGQFSVSQAEKSSKAAVLENQLDIKVGEFRDLLQFCITVSRDEKA